MTRTSALIADSHRGRLFERQARGHTLVELADFVYPNDSALGGGHQESSLTKGHGATGHAGTQSPTAEFGKPSQQCNALVLIAPSPLLGDLRPRLSVSAGNALRHTVASDLTHFEGRELQQRVDQALQFVH